MAVDSQLEKIIGLIDLMKGLSWGAIPVWLSLTIPVIYVGLRKLTPESARETIRENRTLIHKITGIFAFPRIDSFIVYLSLSLFVLGTFTLVIDKNEKEDIRNTGMRIKKYMSLKNVCQISKKDLSESRSGLLDLSTEDIDKVLKLYPNEFIEMENSTIALCDAHYTEQIRKISERLLDNFLSNPNGPKRYVIDQLYDENHSFTQHVVRNLIVDSTRKYTYVVEVDASGKREQVIVVNR